MIVLSPYSKQLRTKKENPKNYPYWKELVDKLGKFNTIVQIGVKDEVVLVPECRFNMPLKEISAIINLCDFWVSVDNFLPHLANKLGKKGVVLWSISDPKIFGYKQNVNILKDRSYLRERQFEIWEQAEYNIDAFVSPTVVVERLKIEGLIK